ncbi:PH domain-containing protein [Nocardioides sp. GCM10027113]|uniref:PH domain-containing protein n=1 Tax=unclassified Nocardioides TaxID=2615069 RepID=UPI003610A682
MVVLRSPLAITVGVLTAWAAVLVLAVLIARVAITDFSQIESPGGALLAVVGAIGTLPDLVRLTTGRLHRWRLELGPDGLTYRGFRTSRTIPWNRVTRVETQRRSPAGIRVESRDGDVVVPILAFGIDPDQLVEEIRTRSRSRQR